jgi:hypothetical protein
MLQPGRRGLGFGVGQEPLTALFASFGCILIATDLNEEKARQTGWVDTHQHAGGLAILNQHRLCDPIAFQQRVQFRYVDMNAIPPDLRDFDFTWSSCSFEHLGSINKGLHFLENQMACLRPGGVAVHTTEFNVSSDQETIDHGGVVLFRRRDIEKAAARLRIKGHAIDLDFDPGHGPADEYIDLPPYTHLPHLKLQLGNYVTTSIGLAIGKNPADSKLKMLDWLPGFFRKRTSAA